MIACSPQDGTNDGDLQCAAPAHAVRGIIDTAHAHSVGVSTGGFLERVLAQGGDVRANVTRYMTKCMDLGFDVLEISTGPLHDD